MSVENILERLSGQEAPQGVTERVLRRLETPKPDPAEIEQFETTADIPGGERPRGVLKVPKTGDFVRTAPIGDLSQSEILTALGFDPNDAPAAARLNAALGTMSPAGIKASLERHFGKSVEVDQDEVAGTIFKVAGETKFRPFDIKELTIGDMAAALPEIAQTSAEVGVALATFVMTGAGPQSIPAALTTEAITAYGTEVARLNLGQANGQPVSDSQIHLEGLKRAGITAVSGPVGTFLFNTFRRLTGRTLPKDMERVHLQLRSAQDEDDIGQKIAESRRIQDEFNGLLSGRPEEARFTLGEATRDLGVIEAEERATTRATGAPLKALDAKNNAAVMRAVDDTFGPTLPKTPASADIDVGRTIQNQALRNVEEERARARELTVIGQEQAVSAEREAFSRAVDEETAVAEARPLMASAFATLKQPLKEERDRIVEQGGNLPIRLSETRGAGTRLLRETKQTNFPSLQKETLDIISEAKEAGVRLQSVWTPNAAGRYTKIKTTPATLREVMNDISNIEETLRRGDLTPKQRRVLRTVGASLRRDMNRDLGKLDPDLHADLLKNNAEFRNLHMQYERGIVGRMLKRVPEREGGGGFQLQDQSVIPTVLANPDNARRVTGILQKGGNAGPRALNVLRTGVLDWINQTPNRFVQKEAAIREILSDRQFQAIKTAKNRREAAAALLNAEKETVQELNRALDLNLLKFDPENLVGATLQPGKFNSFVRARDIIKKKSPEKLAEFDGIVKRFVMKELSPDGLPPTPATINKILDPARGRSIQSHLKEVFGSDYIRRLRVIRDFVGRRRGTLRAAQGEEPVQDLAMIFNDQNTLRGLFRFTRVAAPPLSIRGRAFTAALGVGRENAQRALVNAFVDPVKIEALENLGRAHWNSKFAAQQFAVLGLGHMQDLRTLFNKFTGTVVGEEE